MLTESPQTVFWHMHDIVFVVSPNKLPISDFHGISSVNLNWFRYFQEVHKYEYLMKQNENVFLYMYEQLIGDLYVISSEALKTVWLFALKVQNYK